MSRLQVGGLAVYIPTGDVVTLLQYIGRDCDHNGNWFDNVWRIKANRFLVANDTNNLIMQGSCSTIYLMLLGDQQTQSEFKKEKEMENV